MNKDIINIIKSSQSFEELRLENILPEPFNDTGYFYIYYDEADYKEVLPDIISYIDQGLKVWYNRYYERGKSWENDMINIAKDFKCRAVIFYLSPNSVKSPFFYRLLKAVKDNDISYASINFVNASGSSLIKELNVNEEDKSLVDTLFSNEVTYLRHELEIKEKISYLSKIKLISPLIIRVTGEVATVISVKEKAEYEIIIPSHYEDEGKLYPVENIAPHAFEGCKELKRVVIPDTVKHIGYSPMDEYGNGESVELAGGCVFMGCKSLKEIVLPPYLEEFYSNNFMGCESLKSVTIRSKLRRYLGFHDLEMDADGDVIRLDYLDCGNNFLVTSDEEIYFLDKNYGYRHIFYYQDVNNIVNYVKYKKSKKLILKDEEKGGDFAEGNDFIEDVDLTKSNVEVHQYTFNNLEKLSKITFNDNAQGIIQCLMNCPDLEELHLPRDIKVIDQSICGCNKLTSITFPSELRYISYSSLQHCESLETLIFDSELKEYVFRPYNRNMAKQIENRHYSSADYRLAFKWFIMDLFASLLSPFFLISLLLIIFFPITFYTQFFAGRRAFYDTPSIKKIYIKNTSNKKYKIRGFKKVDSDKVGYSLYQRYKNYKDTTKVDVVRPLYE